MDGLSKSDAKDVWQGTVTWYNKDGSIHQQGNYLNGRLDGDFITFLDGKKLVANYKNGRFSSGKQNVRYSNGTHYFTEHRNDTLIEITYGNNLKGIRFERYSKGKEYDLIIKYYGEEGTFLGQRTKRPNGNYDGIEVFYYYSPMRVRSINHFKGGKQFATSTYYPNGKPRELFEEQPELTKTFFDSKGTILGKMTYLADPYGLKPYQGTLVSFMYGKEEEAYKKSSKITYESGKRIEEILYHENQLIKTKTTFKLTGERVEQVGFDEEGNEISRVEYKDYLPYNGTEILGDKTATYKEGKLIEETTYYVESKKVFSVKTQDEERYYDKDGGLLATLELDNDESYPKPLNGTRYYQDYYGGISSFETYQDGYVVERTSFRDRRIGDNGKKRTFKTIEVYRPETYDKIKEINHYSNGQVQAETTFKKYVEQTGIYYNEQGNLLGKYDFVNKDGLRYKFFGDSDEIEEIEEMKEGKQIRLKKYTYGPNSSYGEINPVLIEDVDINCCASYFNRDGVLIAKATFKDQKPWNGTLYDPKTFEKFTFKEGKREGPYQRLDYNLVPLVEGMYSNGQREGTFTTRTIRGVIKATENYKDDQLHGVSSYFDDEGKLIGKMEYSEGLPLNGTRTVSGFYRAPLVTETYKNGKLVEKIESSDKGKRVTSYQTGNVSETTVFYPDSELKRLTFSIKNGVLNGEVNQYDKEGNVLHKAEVKNGRLVSGTVYLNPPGGDGNMVYSKLTKGDETVELVIYGENEKVLFKAEEHLYFGNATYYLQNLNIRMDYLDERSLY